MSPATTERSPSRATEKPPNSWELKMRLEAERPHGISRRGFHIDAENNPYGIVASCSNGALTVSIPKIGPAKPVKMDAS